MTPAVTGFSKEQLGKVVARNRSVLTYNLEEKLQPLVAALEVTCGSSRAAVVDAASRAPGLLGMALGTVDGNVAAMRRLGLSDADIAQSVTKCSQLFVHDYSTEEFGSKLRYFEEVFGSPPRHSLLEHPSFLMYGLRRVDCRVSTAASQTLCAVLGCEQS